MGCPRCDRVRIERDGAGIRCAVCGMPYDPYQELSAEFCEGRAPLRCIEGTQRAHGSLLATHPRLTR